jgi:hypothetical protein
MPHLLTKPTNTPSPGLFIASPSAPLQLTAENAGRPLPQGPDGDAPLLLYGPYLTALAGFLRQDSCRPLAEAHVRCFGYELPWSELRAIDIISEKHGAFYNVARVRLGLSDRDCAFAVNTAATEHQKAVMVRELRALRELQTILREDLIPRILFEGEAKYDTEGEPSRILKVFMADWFEDFHEFHLSSRTATPPGVVVWDTNRGENFLSDSQANEIYRKASRLLTLCYDEQSGRQVYPWHHAAGDFVVGSVEDGIAVRLITVRDYRRLIAEDGEGRDSLLDLVHFFLNLTLRMRLDRFDGTGELAWAGPRCLDACVAGFLDGCREKHRVASTFPGAPEILGFLRCFEEPEWRGFLEVVAPDGLVDPDEDGFLNQHLAEHARQLAEALVTCDC